MSNLIAQLSEFWRVDNKHGLYSQRDVFNSRIRYSGVIYFCITLVMLIMTTILTIGGI